MVVEQLAKNSKLTLKISDVVKLYKAGMSTADIAGKTNVSIRYINLVLKNNNVERRPRGSWKRQYTLNEDYFKTWSNNMAYILGFFVASKDTQTISIAQKEIEILNSIKTELKSEHPIIQNKKTGVYMLMLNSKIMRKDIIEIHGINPNKCLNLKFPKIPAEFMSHFVRGYFDGDGCIYKDKYFVNIVGGSKSFMESLVKILASQNINAVIKSFEHHYRVYISGDDPIKKFSAWIYKDKELYLQRKYIRFHKENK
ncbi:LAGLIDADG family homing endonuclease [Peribacillus deserti]|uniref:DOD-type homing endonuclease domain-containing protein n=1 Tax=Peribacillus deserti TaxID=673318 RepID=A0A2N5M535_9BACI|nr:LAGLIDADG family homing endonuclease [Peribacillus deserti]PLT29470.1 hypothetical protein CUU66_12860 [Peribacillus deserti]